MKFREPMSAHGFDKHEARIEYPCYVQPKLDGVRCVTDGERFWSRNGKSFPRINIAHLRVHFKYPYLVDGELMIPGAPFEETVSALKHASDGDRSAATKLRFYVFDTISNLTFEGRNVEAESSVMHAKGWGAKWLLVPTYRAKTREQLGFFAKRMLAKGHEGSMVRNAAGLYVHKRSYDLLKWKPLLDGEYPIVEVREAKGKDKGTPVFVCRVPKTRKTFRVRPMGTAKQRRQMWKDREQLLEQMLTVEYQNLTKYGVPRFPRAKVLRDYE